MFLKKLVHKDSSDLFQTRVCDVQFERVWVSEVKVAQETWIILLDCQADFDVVASAIFKEVNKAFLIVTDVHCLETDTVLEPDVESCNLAVLSLLEVDLLEHGALRGSQNNFVSESHQFDQVAVSLQL